MDAMGIRAVIIEDEADAIDLLTSLLKNYVKGVEVVGHATSVKEGIALIDEAQPNLLFLDIQLGNNSGFEVLEAFENKELYVIFTTAYEHHALKAFKFNTIDYLLKPYGVSDLQSAIEKAGLRISKPEHTIGEVLKLIKAENTQQIPLQTSEGIWMLAPKEAIRIEGEGPYVFVYSEDGKRTLVTKRMREIEAILPNHLFFRIHKSHIVNKLHINKYMKEDGGYVLMSNGKQLPVARTKKEAFIEFLLI